MLIQNGELTRSAQAVLQLREYCEVCAKTVTLCDCYRAGERLKRSTRKKLEGLLQAVKDEIRYYNKKQKVVPNYLEKKQAELEQILERY